jgi:hypothetical protein
LRDSDSFFANEMESDGEQKSRRVAPAASSFVGGATGFSRVSDAAEIGLLAGTLAAVWISVGLVVVAAIRG